MARVREPWRTPPGMAKSVYTGIIEKEGDVDVALCPELNVAGQGATVEEATANLREAVELFPECVSAETVLGAIGTCDVRPGARRCGRTPTSPC